MNLKEPFVHILELSRLVLRHAVRTRLIYLVFVFSVLTQVGGLKIVHQVLAHSAGLLPVLKTHHTVFIMLFLQLFGGVLLCVVYGVWVVPYLHSGTRAQLTFVLPVKKSVFAFSSIFGLLALLLIQYISLLLVFGWVLGFSELSAGTFPWEYFLKGCFMEALCFLCLMLLFSILSLNLGPITALFFGVMLLSSLQFASVLKTLGVELQKRGVQTAYFAWVRFYDLLVPVGELVFDLKDLTSKNYSYWTTMAHWAVWLVIFVCGYSLSISRIRRFKASV